MSTLTAGAGPSALRRPWLRTARRSVGIEAGRLKIHVARRRLFDDKEEWSYATLSLPPQDTAKAATTGALAQKIAREAGIRREQATCAINSPSIDVFPLTLQPSGSETLDALVVSQARKLLSIPLNEAVLDYIALPDWVKRPTDETSPVLVFSVPREFVEDILWRTEQLGFHIKRVITPGCALAPLVAGAATDARQLIISISEEATSISVAQNGHVLLERILDWSLNRVVGLLRSEFDIEERQSRSLLARWDPDVDYKRSTDTSLFSNDSFEGDVREVLAPAFRELTREAASCLGYCGSFLQHASASTVVLVGPLGNHSLLRSYLENELGLAVLGPREGLVMPAQDDDPESACYATAACCAMADDKETE